MKNVPKFFFTHKVYVVSLFVFAISVLTLLFGYDPDIIEIKAAYTAIKKPTKTSSRPKKKLKVIKFIDERKTDIVDTYYYNVSTPLYWIVKRDIADILTEAVKSEFEFQGFLIASDEVDFYLFGKIQKIEITVVQRYPEIIEGSIQIIATLKKAINDHTEWTKTMTGRGVAEGKSYMAADQEKAINSAITDILKKLLSLEIFSDDLS